MTWTTRPSLPAGHNPKADEVDAVLDQVDQLTAPEWVTYGSDTTSLTASSVNPTKGSSTYSLEYRLSAGSNLAHVRFVITINTGGGWAAGTGPYRVLLPAAATAGSIAAQLGSCWVNDSGTAILTGVVSGVDSTHVEMYLDSHLNLGSGGPGTAWATGDSIRGSYVYEVG